MEIGQKFTSEELSILFKSLTNSLTDNHESHDITLNVIYKLVITVPVGIEDRNALIHVLCTSIIRKSPSDVNITTWRIIAQLFSHENIRQIMTSHGVASVPENILEEADESLKLRELNECLKQCSIGQPLKQEVSTQKEKLVDSLTVKSEACLSIEESVGGLKNQFHEIHETSSDTMTIPRRWNKVSVRWRSKLRNLTIMSIDKVVRVKDLTFCCEYLIGNGSNGTEVYLGLKDDGTEVAIKRMTKSNYRLLENEKENLRLPDVYHPSIVRYIDFAEDSNFGYLVLQLCEYNLEEYICHHLPEDSQERKDALKTKVEEVLTSLKVLHHPETKLLHRDIKPQNFLIDIRGKARLADLGISRKLMPDQTTHYTSPAGTKFWKAKEVLNAEESNDQENGIKRSSDIQVAGMLAYYILSCGGHPFGNGSRCETNILEGRYSLDGVEDELAKDLIEWMLQANPNDRPKVEETLTHPYLWKKDKRVDYLKTVGNEEEAENCRWADDNLLDRLFTYTNNKTFRHWKTKIPRQLLQEMEMHQRSPYPQNTLALLRFIRNLYNHHYQIDIMALFPDLFWSVFKFAKANNWNSRTSLKKFFEE